MFLNSTFAQNEVKENDFLMKICENEKLNFIDLENSCFKQIDISLLAEKKYKNRIWLKIIVNDKEQKFIVFDQKIDSIKVFTDSDIITAGELVAAHEKPFLLSSNINSVKVPIYQKAFYIQLINTRGQKISPAIEIITEKQFNSNYLYPNQKFSLVQACFQGMLWIIILYNLFLFFSIKEKVYIAYCLYIVGLSVFSAQHTGLLVDYFIPSYPYLAYIFRITGVTLILIGYSFFTLTFLPKDTINRFWRLFFKGISIFLIFLLPVHLFLVYQLQNLPLNILLALSIHFVIMLFTFFIHLFRKFRKNYIVQYFLLGSFMIVGGAFISNTLRFVGVDLIGNEYVLMQIGGVLEILIFSLGLGHRMKRLEQKNAEILKNQNIVLEEKVTERTKEITVQNEELHQQQEEIIAQRDYIEKQNIQLKHTNTQFTDSVRYAKTIQEAILPFKKRLTSNFEEHFVLFRPRDIVSGDFYWIYETKDAVTDEDIILIAVLDCTGHGVPGAFISLIGFAILNEMVAKENITEPAKLLQRLDIRLQEALKQKQTNNMDGMDVVLCSIKKINTENKDDKTQFEVIFAGAKRPLYYIKNNELDELKGNKMSVGGITKKKENTDIEFEEEKIILSQGDKIYLTSDGFADQNGKNQQKIGSIKLKESLDELQNLPLTEQKTKLESILDIHQGKQKQRDDITIMGVKL